MDVKIDNLPDAHPREGDPTAGDWHAYTDAVVESEPVKVITESDLHPLDQEGVEDKIASQDDHDQREALHDPDDEAIRTLGAFLA